MKSISESLTQSGKTANRKRMESKHLHETRIPQRWQRNCSCHSFSPFQHCYTYPATRTFDILQKHFIQTSQLNVFLPYVRLQSGLCVTHGWQESLRRIIKISRSSWGSNFTNCKCLHDLKMRLFVDQGVLSEANRTMRSFRISFCVCVIRRYSSRWRKVVCVHDNKGGKGDPSTLFCHLTNQHAFMSQTLLNLKNRVGSFLAVTAAHPGQPQELSQQKIN